MKAIGGYFGLELPSNGEEYLHCNAVAVNSGRNALKLLLKKRNVERLYLPYYVCEAVLEPVKALDISFEFYRLDEMLEIKEFGNIDTAYHLLYVNYFGLKGRYIKRLASSFEKLIVDNSQAFYDRPLYGIDTFYSPRKFFGVPGGGYMYGPANTIALEQDVSWDRCQHLLKRSDLDAEAGYRAYQKNEEKFLSRPIKGMSALTHHLLANVNYQQARKRRLANYAKLHEGLGKINAFSTLAELKANGPLIYPFKNERIGREELIKQRIYIPQYWPDIVERLPSQAGVERDLLDNLIALPIDQRYSETEMQQIIDVITAYV